MSLTNLLLTALLQILSAMRDEFNISSVYVNYWECDKQLELFSSEGIIRLEIPSQIAAFVAKISYSVATSVEGMMFSVEDMYCTYQNLLLQNL